MIVPQKLLTLIAAVAFDVALHGVLLHAVDQSLPAEVQIPGGVRLVPVELLECAENEFLFNRLQADALWRQIQMKRFGRRAFTL